MKKLLAMGALLVVASTSFGAVTTVLSKTDDSSGKYSGHADLPISVKGKVIDLTGKYALVVTPITTAGADGASLEFDFGDLIPGTENVQQTGKFKAEIFGNGPVVARSGDTLKKHNLNSNGYGTSVITASLIGPSEIEQSALSDGEGIQGKDLIRVSLKSTSESEEEARTKVSDIGEVTYQLVRTDVSGSGDVFEGEVVIDDNAVAGAFNDKSAKVKISVKDFTPKP